MGARSRADIFLPKNEKRKTKNEPYLGRMGGRAVPHAVSVGVSSAVRGEPPHRELARLGGGAEESAVARTAVSCLGGVHGRDVEEAR